AFLEAGIKRQPQQEYNIARSLAEIYAAKGMEKESYVEIDQMRRLAQNLGDKARLLESYALEAKCLIRSKMYRQAIEQGTQAIKDYEQAIAEGNITRVMAEEIGDELEMGEMQVVFGEASRFLGEHDEALEYLRRAESYYRKRAGTDGLAETLRQKTLV